jgi:hypothetical protein
MPPAPVSSASAGGSTRPGRPSATAAVGSSPSAAIFSVIPSPSSVAPTTSASSAEPQTPQPASSASSAPPSTECSKLIGSINRNGQLITKALDKFGASKKTKADADELGRTLDPIGRETVGINLKDPTLKESAKGYRDMLVDLAKAAKEATAGDAATKRRAIEQLERVTRTEDAIVNKINGYCGRS